MKPFAVIIGNVTKDPELKFSASGKAILSFGLAVNNRIKNAQNEWVDGEAEFYDCTAWEKTAENLAETITKGMRLIVVGRLQYQSWEADDGSKRHKVQLVVEEAGPSTKWATATVARNEKAGGGGFRDGAPTPPEPTRDYNDDPFVSDAADWMPGLWGQYPKQML